MYLKKLTSWHKCRFRNQSFVFLNACESATAGYVLQMLGLPSGLLSFGAGRVIAMVCAPYPTTSPARLSPASTDTARWRGTFRQYSHRLFVASLQTRLV
jgi:hypothetical protein